MHDDFQMWNSREWGKVGYWAPEQFTSEWEYVDCNPHADGAQLAGRYGWKSNLYSIGWIMWSFITRLQPPAGPVRNDLSLSIPGQPNKITTFGGHLTNDGRYNNIDPELRLLVARCLAEFPRDRPSMDEIQAAIGTALHLGNPNHVWLPPNSDQHISAGSHTRYMLGRLAIPANNNPISPQPAVPVRAPDPLHTQQQLADWLAGVPNSDLIH
ncbi:hypothetical protein B0T25DRAFT_530543 [Lasiosphaeria hispida]|uniref:Protein kinase domain-containing protein n=1 Tax=Lasiosphaeria hispida TaxID=260671 RepID=A0AAJ0HXM5_9PEZI|nr:hypothetical protein B0T25DRAFT_530543 [Lasiosphaeria hispida]